MGGISRTQVPPPCPGLWGDINPEASVACDEKI